MVCLRCDKIQSTTLAEAVGVYKTVNPDNDLLRTARSLGITFGD
jgi:hypothetical protein